MATEMADPVVLIVNGDKKNVRALLCSERVAAKGRNEHKECKEMFHGCFMITA
jgi:hypothetical protein